MKVSIRAGTCAGILLWLAAVGCNSDELTKITPFVAESPIANEVTADEDSPLVIRVHDKWISNATYSPNGEQFVTCSVDQSLRIWDASSGRCLHHFIADCFVLSVAYSPDGRQLVAATINHGIHVFDTESWNTFVAARAKEQPQALAFSPDSQLLAAGTGSIELFQTSDWRRIRHVDGHEQGGDALGFSSDGQYLISGNADGFAKVWSVPRLQTTFKSKHDGWVNSVDAHPIRSEFVAASMSLREGSREQTLFVYDRKTGVKISESYGQVLRGNLPGGDAFVKFSPNGKYLVSTFRGEHNTGVVLNDVIQTEPEGDVSVWDANSFRLVARDRGKQEVSCVAFSPDSQKLLIANGPGIVEIWDIDQFIRANPVNADSP